MDMMVQSSLAVVNQILFFFYSLIFPVRFELFYLAMELRILYKDLLLS